MDFRYIGELINEDKIVHDGQRSTGLLVEGHFPEKAGFTTYLPTAQAGKASRAIVNSLGSGHKCPTNVKVNFLNLKDDSGLLLRPSGTDPLVRIYAESESAVDIGGGK